MCVRENLLGKNNNNEKVRIMWLDTEFMGEDHWNWAKTLVR